MWLELFGAAPPRGTLARLARRANAKLHESMQKHGWECMGEWLAEIKRMRRWYKPGRKLQRRRTLGIKRKCDAADHACGKASAWGDKVQKHYKKLVKRVRRKGLLGWRKCACALRTAGVNVHTGTVPVERMWSFLLDVFPKASRTITHEWFELLADLAYMRINYRHFNHSSLPGWTEGDSLLAQRIDMMVALTRALHAQEGSAGPALAAIREAFAPGGTG